MGIIKKLFSIILINVFVLINITGVGAIDYENEYNYQQLLEKAILISKINLEKVQNGKEYVKKIDTVIDKLKIDTKKLTLLQYKIYELKNKYNDLEQTNKIKILNSLLDYIDDKIHLELYKSIIDYKINSLNDTPLVLEAGKLGLNTNDLKKCISENRFIDNIKAEKEFGEETFGITGTPGNVLINNETGEYSVISGAYPKESFIEIIDKLLSGKEKNIIVSKKENISNKDFIQNTDENTLVIISDKRDSTTPVDELVIKLKEIEVIKNMTIKEYDFYDNGVKKYLETNKINTLPVILFTKNNIDENVNQYITEINEKTFTLNIGAQFNPFQELSPKGFKIINKTIINKIKEKSYINGNKYAKITWLEYSDLECPYCTKLHNSDVESTLKEKYGTELNIIFNHFPLDFHQKAIPGANILECVGELGGSEAFYSIIDFAYKNEIQE